MRPLPPARFDLGDAVLRWSEVGDAPRLAAAARASFEHLRPWMTWATSLDVMTDPAMAAFLTGAIEKRAEGTEVAYSLWTPDERTVLGGAGIHDRVGAGSLEIGYWLAASATGRGLVTRAAALLTDAALAAEGVERVEIHCDEANARSAAVAARLGYRLDRVVPDEEYALASGRLMVWIRDAPIGVPVE